MKRLSFLPIIVILSLIPVSALAAQKVTPGSTCKVLNQKVFYQNKTYTCIKSGMKLVWNKGVVIVTPTPTPTPTPRPTPTLTPTPTPTSTPTPAPIVERTPTGFSDLVENFKGVYLSAWNSSDVKMQSSKPTEVKQNIFVGSKTQLPSSDIPAMFTRGTQFFSGYLHPSSFNAIYYGYDDIAWAQDKIFELSGNPRERDQIPFNCNSRESCNGANANLSKPGIGQINFGVLDKGHPDDYHLKGGVEIHEYAHLVQFMQFQGKGISNNNGGLGLLPNWFVEGHAHTAGNLGSAFTVAEYKRYRSFWLKAQPVGLKDHSPESIESFYEKLAPGKVDSTVASNVYSIGFFTVEAMIAVKGVDSPMELIKLVSEGSTWDAAFLKIYGISWKEAAPILAKTVSRMFLER